MDFKKLFEIYGDELPSMLEFLYDGKHDITLKMIAKHYGARKGYLVWALFVKDFAMYVMRHKAELASVPKTVVKTVVDEVEDVVDAVEDVVDGITSLFKKDDEDESDDK